MGRPSWIGQTLGGRYRIDSLLGQGGMSAVYKAYDPNLKRVVAVKMIHAHLAEDPKFLTRFEEEATAVAQLRHPNIVQVYDFNHDGDLYYMVQEFVPGETLQERLRRLNQTGRRMPVEEAVRITQQICEAAGYAHRRGMIHRDIKPANIMLDVHGQAILMDFGIVKITGGDRHTATGAVVGTAIYLPPELIRGETPDPRSDLYSLGVTLFEAISGRPPFEADSAMTLMMMHLHDPLPDLRQLRPDVPEALIEVIERSLAKDREGRYASLAALAAALQPVLEESLGRAPARSMEETLRETLGPAPVDIQPAPNARPGPLPPAGRHTLAGESGRSAGEPPALAVAGQGAPPVRPAPAPREPQRSPAAGDQGTPAAPVEPHGSSPLAGPASSGAATGQAGHLPVGPPPPGVGSWAAAPGGVPVVPAAAPALQRSVPRLVWLGGAAVLVVLVLITVFIALRGGAGGGEGPLSGVAVLPSNTPPAAALAAPTEAPTATPMASLTPTVTPVLPPTATPTPTLSPTPTIPAGVLFARITGITTDNQGRYVVAYETFDDAKKTDGMQHVHFFFNTTPPEAAGRPGNGNWYVYFGPPPFEKFRLVDRPDAAVQMCILVANPDHSVQFNSGNCFSLPDIVAAAPLADAACLAGPAEGFPAVAALAAGQAVLVNGLSPDEAWWNVTQPQDPAGSCWLLREATTVSGDIGTLPLVEPPPLPTGAAPAGLSVDIHGINLDSQGRYVVDFSTTGYTPAIPGTHIHFYFNSVPLDDGGGPGSSARIMYAGPAPFTGYTAAQRPAEATQLCALVANPDHSVIAGSGNCSPLPDVAQP